MPISDADKQKIIDWVTCPGQSHGIMEGGDVDPDLTLAEIENFILQLRRRFNAK